MTRGVFVFLLLGSEGCGSAAAELSVEVRLDDLEVGSQSERPCFGLIVGALGREFVAGNGSPPAFEGP